MDAATDFQKFVGRPVKLNEVKTKYKDKEYSHFEYDEQDPTIVEINTLVAQKSLKLRVWTPGMAGTCDWWTDRINVHIEPVGQGFGQVKSVAIG
jgi:hypothetical protein